MRIRQVHMKALENIAASFNIPRASIIWISRRYKEAGTMEWNPYTEQSGLSTEQETNNVIQ